MKNTPLLEIAGLRGGYGSGEVLHGVDLSVSHGGVTALLGRNGMGKSTTIKAIMGMLPEQSGTINFDGRSVCHLPSHKRAKLGIGLVPEARQVFRSLSVREHLEVAARKSVAGSRSWTTARLMDLFPVLGKRASSSGANLSGGEQQLLVIARALSTNPQLLLLDEPTEGLAPSIVLEIRDLLHRLREEPDAPAILVVEQNLRFALSVADRAVVLVHGEVAFADTAEELSGRRDLQRSLIGLGV